jgi:nucleoside-diphosphate-sugar epimerase
MKRKGTIFITGATGLVGCLLTMRALRAGHRVRLLVRTHQGQSSGERIRLTLTMLGLPHDQWCHLWPHIEIYEGDITEPQFGLSRRTWQQLADGVLATYHAAAFSGFQNHQAAQARAVNIGGTQNILKLTELSRAHLFHVSSAYIAGDTESRVFEREVETPPRWKNPYEETKFLAEHHVHSHCRENGLTYTVFRPAVLIGDSVHGRTIRFTSIYHYMKLFHRLSTRRKTSSVILEARPGASLNILPVDFAIGAIWDISQSPECEGKVFHITNPSPPKFAELISIAERIFGLRIELVDLSSSGKATSLSHYRPYLFGEPEFDVTNTRFLLRNYDAAFPELNEGYFRKILKYAVEQHWGKHQFTTLPQKEGKSLDLYGEVLRGIPYGKAPPTTG